MPEFQVTYAGNEADDLASDPVEAFDLYGLQETVEARNAPSAILELNAAFDTKAEPGERYFVLELATAYTTWNIDEHEAIVGAE